MLLRDAIRFRSGHFDNTSIFSLDVSNLGLQQKQADRSVNDCIQLTRLNLSGNNLTSLSFLESSTLCRLKTLIAASNSITKLDDIGTFDCVETLHLENNKIKSLNDLFCLPLKFPNLRRLYLRNADGSCSNPVCDSANYRSTILTILPHLEVLDAERLKSAFSITDVTSQLHKRFPSKPHELIRQFLDTNTTPIIDWSQAAVQSVRDPSENIIIHAQKLQDEISACSRLLARGSKAIALCNRDG